MYVSNEYDGSWSRTASVATVLILSSRRSTCHELYGLSLDFRCSSSFAASRLGWCS